MNKSGLFALSAVCCILLTACGDSELEYYDTQNGVCYCVEIRALQDKAEQFHSDIQSILESIKIK